MARLLVQLKLRLIRNALRSSTTAQTSFIVSTFFAVVVAAGVFWLLAILRGTNASAGLSTLVFTAFAIGWLVLPIFAFGLDGTLDPATLALYPLRTRSLAVGLLAASATGAWPAANLVALLGVTVGLARGGLGLLFALLAVPLQVLFCITLARLVTTSMARLLRSRRGKDLAVFLVIPVFAVVELFGQVLPRLIADGGFTGRSFSGTETWLSWLPPGLAVHAIQDASDGRPAAAVLRLALLAAVIVVLGWLWVRSLSRALVSAETSGESSHSRGKVLPLARYGVRGAVIARTWIYQRREPASLVFWGVTAVIMFVTSASSIFNTANRHPDVVLGSAAVGAAFVGYFHANSVGLSGPPFTLEALALTSRRDLRSYFSGQNIALSMIAIPLLTVISFGLAAALGRPGLGFTATAVALAGLGAALAISTIFSVNSPYPMQKRGGSPMRQAAPGYTGYTLGGLLGNVIGVGVLISPVIVAVVLTGSAQAAVRIPVLLVCSAAYGLGLTWAGVQIAARDAAAKLPELCQVALASKL
jgi:ABC-2 type transport system permease protein